MSDLESRIDVCRGRLEAAPASRAFIPLADALRQAGRCDEALTVLESGLARHPRAVAALVTLARTYAGLGRPAQAAEVAGRVLEADPDNLVALELLGQQEQRRGDLLAAMGHFERLAQLEPDDRHWAEVLGQLRQQRQAATAVGGVNEADGFATLTLVDLYLSQGYHRKAAALLQRLGQERPGDPEIGARLAAVGALPAIGGRDEAAAADRDAAPERMPPGASTVRREQSREQFAMWIDRLRSERGSAQP